MPDAVRHVDGSQEGWKWGIRVARRRNKGVILPPSIFPQRPLYGVAK